MEKNNEILQKEAFYSKAKAIEIESIVLDYLYYNKKAQTDEMCMHKAMSLFRIEILPLLNDARTRDFTEDCLKRLEVRD